MKLRHARFLYLDLQTTSTQVASGHPLELAWAAASPEETPAVQASLLALPSGAEISKTVTRLTGLDAKALEVAPAASDFWRRALCEISTSGASHAVIHYARFELPFLSRLHAETGEGLLLPVLCAHQVARRLLPELPAWGLRALSGHFGAPLPECHRAGVHVEATHRIWGALVRRLSEQGIETMEDLETWLAAPRAPSRRRRQYHVPREIRLALPEAPGVYRMRASDGSVLYVGKATSLKDRVNSYFRVESRRKVRLAEMLAQVRAVDVSPTMSPLEAALLETDEIKRWDPPYNAVLRGGNRRLSYRSTDFSKESPTAAAGFPFGPYGSPEAFEHFLALAQVIRGERDPGELFEGLYDEFFFDEAMACAVPGWTRQHCASFSNLRLLRLARKFGLKLGEAREAAEIWTPKLLAANLRESLAHASEHARRARWLLRLSESSVAWEVVPGGAERRCLVLQRGEISEGRCLSEGEGVPLPPGWRSRFSERADRFNIATYDRIRTLWTELLRLSKAGHRVTLRLSPRSLLLLQ